MVQAESNLTLTLNEIGASGSCLSDEQKSALAYSIPLKKREAGLSSLTVWGRVVTTNGNDYIVAEGTTTGLVYKGVVHRPLKHYFSQDGVNWADLAPITDEEAAICAKLNTQFSGDAALVYQVGPDGKQVLASGEPGEEAPTVEGAETVTEIKRLKYLADTISTTCGVAPVGSLIEDAENNIIVNLAFRGMKFPEKLESYIKVAAGPAANETIAKDPRGTWTVRYDQVSGKALVRSMVWLGYTFYYDSQTATYGGMYVGTGIRNNDLIFML